MGRGAHGNVVFRNLHGIARRRRPRLTPNARATVNLRMVRTGDIAVTDDAFGVALALVRFTYGR
jgi:hypothetical protein